MKRTSIGWLIALALIGVGVGWALVRIVDVWAGRILGVPLMASLALWALAIGVLLWAVISRPRLLGHHHRSSDRPGAASGSPMEPIPVETGDRSATRRSSENLMPPLLAARTAALALAASRTGALVGGFYAGISAALVNVMSTPSGQSSLTAAIIALGACVVLAGAAAWLESMCRLR
jgi:hypothetical protein